MGMQSTFAGRARVAPTFEEIRGLVFDLAILS